MVILARDGLADLLACAHYVSAVQLALLVFALLCRDTTAIRHAIFSRFTSAIRHDVFHLAAEARSRRLPSTLASAYSVRTAFAYLRS
ncbi:hypothetical protein BJY59DRAFT_696439, partial [Rhodotorula toruloides]